MVGDIRIGLKLKIKIVKLYRFYGINILSSMSGRIICVQSYPINKIVDLRIKVFCNDI